jgi:hypothetical protein
MKTEESYTSRFLQTSVNRATCGLAPREKPIRAL